VSARDPTQRFSDRAADYVRGRPGYPPALLDLLADRCGLGPASVVADLGSGTGILTELLLARAGRVYAVEPSEAMAAAARLRLAGRAGFVDVRGRSEATGLGAAAVDVATAAQALHWFEPEATRRELLRILKPEGWVVAVWNSRRTESSEFLRAYEALLRRWGTDYASVHGPAREHAAVRGLFAGGRFEQDVLPNAQSLDRDALRARLLSSSYVPAAGDPRCAPMLDDLDALFARHQRGGTVSMEYDTEVFRGRRADLS
jgi:SAM-dependent methyltransferase